MLLVWRFYELLFLAEVTFLSFFLWFFYNSDYFHFLDAFLLLVGSICIFFDAMREKWTHILSMYRSICYPNLRIPKKSEKVNLNKQFEKYSLLNLISIISHKSHKRVVKIIEFAPIYIDENLVCTILVC